MVGRLFLSWLFYCVGVLIIPTVKGSAYKEPHILVIRVYRPAMEAYVLSIPAGTIQRGRDEFVGLVDKGETPLCAALRELKEETGYTGSYINVRVKRWM